MRVAIIGAGGMGGYLGAHLAAAGEDVVFVARGAHLEAMRRNGLRVSGVETLSVPRIVATDTTQGVAAVDAALFCVKRYDTAGAAELLRPLLGADAVALTVQNGIDAAEQLEAVIGTGRALAGAAYFPANIRAPGEIAYLGRIPGKPLLAFGEPAAGDSPRARALAEVLNAAGLDAEVVADTRLMLWEKFCLMAGTSASTAVTRQTIGRVRGDANMRWLLAEAIAEAARVGRALGVPLAADVEARTLAFLDGNPADGKASQLVDLERGRALELDSLSGTIVRLGAELGVPTPVHATVYAACKPFINGDPARS